MTTATTDTMTLQVTTRTLAMMGLLALVSACGGADTLSAVTCDNPRIAGTLACAVCGNGIVEEGETCDTRGIVTDACEYGQADCTLCNDSCQLVKQAGSYCGDGIVDTAFGETCDDGDDITTDSCPSGFDKKFLH